MDAQQFLAEFWHIANAPGGVARLRALVLQLAISGRLTEREVNDTSAIELIKANRIRKEDLIAQRSLRRQPEPKPVSKSDEPWILPEGWAWTRLGAVTNYGDAPKVEFADVNEDTWVLELEDIEKGTSKLLSKALASQRKFKSTKNAFPTGAILYGKLRPYLDKVLIADSAGVCSTEISPISFFEHIHAGYLRWYLKSPYFVAYANGSTYGMNLPRLGTDSARMALFSFPPKKEQSRIVAKVDELMALCDQLEQQQQDRRKLQNALRQSTLQAVASAQSPNELQSSWQRLQANFNCLFGESTDVGELRNLVLQLGIRGLLVDQTETDRSAVDDFVADVKAKRDELVARGLIRRSTSLPPVEQDEEPFPLPRGWRFCRLGEVSICRDGQRIPLSKAERAPRNGIYPYYGASGIIDHIDDYIFGESLLLVGEDGANLINRSTPIAFIASGRYWVNNHAHVLDSADLVGLRYLEIYINAIDLKPHVTGTAQPKMNQEKMNLIVVAVAPPAEQALIVERVSELMKVCDDIETRLHDAGVLAQRLATAVVSAIAGVGVKQEDEVPMKAPQTELIVPLRLGQPPDVKVQAPLATILVRHNGELPARDLWQRFGGEVDAFYAQLKFEVAHGWIVEPEVAEVRERVEATVT